jgi:hypothetical protein
MDWKMLKERVSVIFGPVSMEAQINSRFANKNAIESALSVNFEVHV